MMMLSLTSHEPDNETEHIVWGDINSETDTPEDSNSHGSGTSPRSTVIFKKNGTWADLNDSLDPDSHLSILSNLIRQLDEPPSSVNGSKYRYAQFAKKIGAKTIEEQILSSLEKDLRRLIKTGSLNFDTIKWCEKSKARSCLRPSVYIHVIYGPADLDYIGVYIESPLRIGPRMKDHIEDLDAAKKHKKKGKKLKREKRHLNTVHINF